MNKLIDKRAFSVEFYHQNKCIIGLSKNFVMIDVNARKNTFDTIYPKINNCNNIFFSEDESVALILNTTGTALLYDVANDKVLHNEILFGDELYNQCFVSHKNGFYYLNQANNVDWFDYRTVKKSKSQFSEKYSFLYDDKDKAFFIAIDETGYYPHYNLLSIKCFSKKSEQFEPWSISLPKGNLKIFKRINKNSYLIVLEQEEYKEIRTKIYLFELTNKHLIYLFDEQDFLDNENDEFFLNFEIDLSAKKGYILYSNSLKVIDLEKKFLMRSVVFEEAWDLKLVSKVLIVATGKGVYRLKLSELNAQSDNC